MYVNIRQLREYGMRRKNRDIDADNGVCGRLTGYIEAHHPVIRLYKWGSVSAEQTDILFPLYEPVIASLSERGMIVRGLQRASFTEAEPAPTCFQEWSIRFLQDAPITDGVIHGPKPPAS